MSTSYERVEPKNRKTLRAWLSKHHLTSPGIWVVLEKGDGQVDVTSPPSSR